MTSSGKILSIFILASALFGLSVQAEGTLRLSLESDKKKFLRGEPVIVYATLKNTGSAAVEVTGHLAPEYGLVTYFIEEPGKSEEAFAPWALREPSTPQRVFAPGEEVKRAAKVFFGGNGWSFQRPGKYKVRAVYEGHVTSNILEVTIIESKDASDEKAADLFLGSEEVGKFLLFEGGDHLKEGVRRVEQVVQEMPGSPHAAYAKILLAANQGRDFADFTAGRLRPADPQQAIGLAERAESRLTSFYYIVRWHLVLAEALERTGDRARAAATREALDKLTKEKYPGMIPFLREEMHSRRPVPVPSEP